MADKEWVKLPGGVKYRYWLEGDSFRIEATIREQSDNPHVVSISASILTAKLAGAVQAALSELTRVYNTYPAILKEARSGGCTCVEMKIHAPTITIRFSTGRSSLVLSHLAISKPPVTFTPEDVMNMIAMINIPVAPFPIRIGNCDGKEWCRPTITRRVGKTTRHGATTSIKYSPPDIRIPNTVQHFTGGPATLRLPNPIPDISFNDLSTTIYISIKSLIEIRFFQERHNRSEDLLHPRVDWSHAPQLPIGDASGYATSLL